MVFLFDLNITFAVFINNYTLYTIIVPKTQL